jgi:hypothetical protein
VSIAIQERVVCSTDKHERVILIEYIATSPTPAAQDASTEKARINKQYSIGDMYPDDPMEEANRCFPALISRNDILSMLSPYRKNGSLPKRTTKTKAENPRIAIAMVRRSPMALKMKTLEGQSRPFCRAISRA